MRKSHDQRPQAIPSAIHANPDCHAAHSMVLVPKHVALVGASHLHLIADLDTHFISIQREFRVDIVHRQAQTRDPLRT
jgi:hypothetical protein